MRNIDIYDVMVYGLLVICLCIVLSCFTRCCSSFTAYELEELSEIEIDRQERQAIREIEERLYNEEDIRQNNIELDNAFRQANLERVELAEMLLNYVKHLKEKQRKEEMIEEMQRNNTDDIVVFINPGDELPVLGELIVD